MVLEVQLNLNELKRKKICPILWKKNWDFKSTDPRLDFFRFCLSEVMRWQHRKGRAISYDVLSSLISFYSVRNSIDKVEASHIQGAFKSFTNSNLYSKIEELITNAEIQIGISNHVIKHRLPALGTTKDKTIIFTWEEDVKNIEDMKQKYETRFASIWSFYSLNRYPVFYNLYLEENKIKHVRYKPNQFYIRDSKSFILNMRNLIEDSSLYPASLELCNYCERRGECQTKKTRTKNWQKSW